MNKKLLRVLSLIAILVLSAGLTVAVAQDQPPPPAPRVAEQAEIEEYLLPLPMPRLSDLDVPAGLSRTQAKWWVERLAWDQAKPLQEELNLMRSRGEIVRYEIEAEQFAIRVQRPLGETKAIHSALSDGLSVENDTEAVACMEKSAQALQQQILGLSRTRLMRENPSTPHAPDSDPSIHAYVVPGGEWNIISGQTTASTPVDIRILRGSTLIFDGSVTSDSTGYYELPPEWSGCLSEYNWVLQTGDVVEATAHGSTVSTIIAALSAWVDPVSNTVEGMTEPGRSAGIELMAAGASCDDTEYVQSVPTDGAGHFLADFTSTVDFDRRSWAYVYALDASGNSTYFSRDAFYFENEFTWEYFSGVLHPDQTYTATLSRSGPVIDTYIDVTALDGSYYGYFSDVIQSGDVVEVTDGEHTINYTATSLDAELDASTEELSGTTGVGRRVQARFEKRDFGYIYTACSSSSECLIGTADGSGVFSLTSPYDIERGDLAWVDVFDSEGNIQFSIRNSPAILGDLTYEELHGFWSEPNETVNFVLKDSTNAVKDEYTTWADWDGEFADYFIVPVVPGDHIEVGDGVITETMTVQNLSGRLNHNTGHLIGGANNDDVLATVSDFRSDLGTREFACQETVASGDSYDINFSAMQIGSRDYADVFNTGPDGHYTYRFAPAFTVSVYLKDAQVWGYSTWPDSPVTVNIWNGGTLEDTNLVLSDYEGYFDAYFGGQLLPGRRVEVLAYYSANITLPTLTLNLDPDQNRIYGQAPANKLVNVYFDHEMLCSKGNLCDFGGSQYVSTDSGGNYSAFFDGVISDGCQPSQVGPCAWPLLIYWDELGYAMYYDEQEPLVSADSWEGDNSFDTAKPYAGRSEHTFHIVPDVDWIAWTVSAGMAGRPWHLQTLNLGIASDTVLEVYGTNGTTLLASNDDFGNEYRSRVVWSPPSEGTYYIKVKPYDAIDNTAICGATYDFVILSPPIFVPVFER